MNKKIIYIGGIGHSGSTILSILLGQMQNAQCIGEFGNFYEFNRKCSCGYGIQDCEVWGDIYRSLNHKDFQKLKKVGKLVNKEKKLLSFLYSSNLREKYCYIFDKIHDIIFNKTGTNVLIDSSKNLSRAIALLKSSRYDVNFIHLIRDPRGFINSMYRKYTYTFIKSTIKWAMKNYFASLVINKMYPENYICILYEDLLLKPHQTFREISKFTDIDFSLISYYIKNSKKFDIGHIFSGNRISNNSKILFDPTRIKSNKIKKINNNIFWYVVGWLSSYFGYDRKQNYMNNIK